MQSLIGEGAMTVEEITLALFAACNSFRVVYVPQILKPATNTDVLDLVHDMELVRARAPLHRPYALINRPTGGWRPASRLTLFAALPF